MTEVWKNPGNKSINVLIGQYYSNPDSVGVNLDFELRMRLLWLFQKRAELLCWRKQNPEISTSRSGKGWLYIWTNTGGLYCLVKSARVF